MIDTEKLLQILADTKNKLVAPTAKLRAMAPDLAAEVIRLRAENAALVERVSKGWAVIDGYLDSHIRRDPEDCTCFNCKAARAWLAGKDGTK
jgi:hypothetical protein